MAATSPLSNQQNMNAIAQMRSNDEDPRLLAATLEVCGEKLAIVDSGRLLYSNRAFSKTLGYSHSADVRGIPLTRLFAEHQWLTALQNRYAGKALRDPAYHDNVCVFRRDGSRITVQLSCVPLRVDGCELLILSLRERGAGDVVAPPGNQSEQMQALGRLSAAVAHDFNNLLTGILLYCDLLIAGLETHSPLRNYVTEIRRAGGHSAELIQQLMAFARPDNSSVDAHSWSDVISAMHNLLLRLLGENIELQMALGSPDAYIHMNAAQMRQIVLNLLLNARDAMPNGGRIRLMVVECRECLPEVESGPRSPCIVLAVEDDGFGMDSETRSRLFETFFTTKPARHGNGLGLSSISCIVQERGGNIRVQSEPGCGTRMSVHLPRAYRTVDFSSITEKENATGGNSL